MSDLLAAVDLGGTNITCALAAADGEIVAEAKRATGSADGPTAVLERIAAMVGELSAEIGATPAALGMCVPGLVDRAEGVTKFLPNFPGKWPDVPVRKILSTKLGCEVHILNDVRAATLGELTYGHGQTANTMAFFALGTGIGGGIVVDKKLRLGPLGAAGELGHQIIIPDGPLCGCGNHGCLETLASGPAIAAEGVRMMLSGLAPNLHRIVNGESSRVTPKEMAAAVEAGDETIRDAIVRAATWLGIGVLNVVIVLHPDLIVLGGGVAEMGPILLDTVERTVRSRIGMFPTDGVRFERSALGVKAGILGAVALAKARGEV